MTFRAGIAVAVLLGGLGCEADTSRVDVGAAHGDKRLEGETLTAKFVLDSGVLEVDTSTLESIRDAVVAYLRDPDDAFKTQYGNFRDQFLNELEQADCIIGMDGTARADAWILEANQDATALALVRHPPRGATMYLFHAEVAKTERGAWTVTSFGQSRVFE